MQKQVLQSKNQKANHLIGKSPFGYLKAVQIDLQWNQSFTPSRKVAKKEKKKGNPSFLWFLCAFAALREILICTAFGYLRQHAGTIP